MIQKVFAWGAIGFSGVTIATLLVLHVLSPEFDPSWRMVSEYANGDHPWLLAVLFLAWGLGTLGLVGAIWGQSTKVSFRIGLGLLALAAIGELMAAVFDLKHPLHDVAGYLGILGLPVAALLLGKNRGLAWMPLVSLGVFVVTFVLLMVTYASSGATIDPSLKQVALPEGVIALVGWTNRLLIVVYTAWVGHTAWKSLRSA